MSSPEAGPSNYQRSTRVHPRSFQNQDQLDEQHEDEGDELASQPRKKARRAVIEDDEEEDDPPNATPSQTQGDGGMSNGHSMDIDGENGKLDGEGEEEEEEVIDDGDGLGLELSAEQQKKLAQRDVDG